MTLIPNAIREAMFKPASDDGVIAIWEINRPAWLTPLRYTSHEGDEPLSYYPLRTGVTHGGNEYLFAAVAGKRPDDRPGQLATIPLTIENANEDLGALSKQSVNDLTISLKHVAISDPDSIIEEFPVFAVIQCLADFDANTVQFSLTLDTVENEPSTTVRFTPDQFGGLFP